MTLSDSAFSTHDLRVTDRNMQAPARAQALLCSRGSAARPVRGCRCASATPSRGPEAAASLVAGALAVLLATASPCGARLEGVNNPSLLPAGDPVPVLDVAGFLSKGQVARLTARVEKLERDTGVRLRVLVQSYPQTPGLAVRDWWRVDDSTVVFVADPGLGNLVNVNVGKVSA